MADTDHTIPARAVDLVTLQRWSEKARSYSEQLDKHGWSRNDIAIVAGNLLDLAQEIEHAIQVEAGRK